MAGSNNNKKITSKSGFTILEITVAVAIFSVVVVLSTSIFKGVTLSQRNALASQVIQENMRFAFESISREIRTAIGDQGGSLCAVPSPGTYKVFNTNGSLGFSDSGNILYFENYKQECVAISTTTAGRLQVKRGSAPSLIITPNEIVIKNLSFFVIDDFANEFHSLQPRVTMVVEAEIKGGQAVETKTVKMQTTISSRHYK